MPDACVMVAVLLFSRLQVCAENGERDDRELAYTNTRTSLYRASKVYHRRTCAPTPDERSVEHHECRASLSTPTASTCTCTCTCTHAHVHVHVHAHVGAHWGRQLRHGSSATHSIHPREGGLLSSLSRSPCHTALQPPPERSPKRARPCGGLVAPPSPLSPPHTNSSGIRRGPAPLHRPRPHLHRSGRNPIRPRACHCRRRSRRSPRSAAAEACS